MDACEGEAQLFGADHDGLGHYRGQDVLLALKVVKEAAGLNTEGAGEIPNGGAIVALASKEIGGRAQEGPLGA